MGGKLRIKQLVVHQTAPLAKTPELIAHPHVPGWKLALLSVAKVAEPVVTGQSGAFFGISLTQQHSRPILETLYRLIKELPARTLIGIDFSGIAGIENQLLVQLGPELVRQTLAGHFGPAKRLVYLFGESRWLCRDLEWVFENSLTVRAQDNQVLSRNRAALAPSAQQGYCGVLAPIYAEALALINRHGSLSSLELYSQLQRRYRVAPAHADQCLAVLAQLGLLYRQSSHSTPQSTYDLNARGYALSLSEELFYKTIASTPAAC